MKAYRAAILRFDPSGEVRQGAIYEQDGLLVVGPGPGGVQTVRAVGPYRDLIARFPDIAVEHLPGRIIAPGFVDLHIHYAQTDVIGSPSPGLLPWLENYTFPEEKRFSAHEYSTQTATFFIAELLRNGVTTALTFATSHPESVNALFSQAELAGMRLITGKCLQDRHSPDGVRDETEQGLIDSETLIGRWHGKGRLGYAIKKPSYTFYVAKSGEVIDGYALIDEELGQHLPITFAVKFSPQGVVQRQEVMIYRERYGDEIRDPRFRQQFEGKTAADPLRASEEIIAVSGATISSRAMTVGVHRALVLLDELILSPQRPRSAQLAPSSARSLAAPTL